MLIAPMQKHATEYAVGLARLLHLLERQSPKIRRGCSPSSNGCSLAVILVLNQNLPCPSPALRFEFNPALGLRKAAQHLKH